MEEGKEVVEQPNSCKILINAKGQFSGEVKVYAGTSVKALEEAKLRAGELLVYIKDKND